NFEFILTHFLQTSIVWYSPKAQSSITFKPAVLTSFIMVSVVYIRLFPLANTVKYKEVASRMNRDDGNNCLSVKVSMINNSVFSSIDSAQTRRIFTISSSEKQSKN